MNSTSTPRDWRPPKWYGKQNKQGARGWRGSEWQREEDDKYWRGSRMKNNQIYPVCLWEYLQKWQVIKVISLNALVYYWGIVSFQGCCYENACEAFVVFISWLTEIRTVRVFITMSEQRCDCWNICWAETLNMWRLGEVTDRPLIHSQVLLLR